MQRDLLMTGYVSGETALSLQWPKVGCNCSWVPFVTVLVVVKPLIDS